MFDIVAPRRRFRAPGAEWHPLRGLFWDLVAVTMIGLVACLLRVVGLADLPPGLHGDEAATGLEARRVLEEGWIGVYSGVAGGNPTGHYYLAAAASALVSNPVIAVRAVSAIGGTLAVIGLYFLVRRHLGVGSALMGSILLAVAQWHLQFSRTGFVTGTWVLVALLATIALMEAIRSSSWWWWAATGALLASGVYIYNGHGPYMLVVGLFIGLYVSWWMVVSAGGAVALVYLVPSPVAALLLVAGIGLLAFDRGRRERTRLVNAAAFAVSLAIVLSGMVDFVKARPNEYFGRGQTLALFGTDEWQARDGALEKIALVIERYWLFWDRLTFHPVPDGVDLSGVTPVIPLSLLAICLLGAAIALWRRPTALVLLSAVSVVLAPLSAVLTDMTLRRALVIMPFLALLGGVGGSELLRMAFARRRALGMFVALGLSAAIVKSSVDNYTDFFVTTVASESVQHTFAVELRATSYFLDWLPDDAYVYFFSDRWVLRYDVPALLAPDVRGEDRLPKWGGSGGLEIDRAKGVPVFVLLGDEIDRLSEIRQRYPGGEVVRGPDLEPPRSGPSYVAYLAS